MAERRPDKCITAVWSFTQPFRPLSPKFYRGSKCSKFGLDFEFLTPVALTHCGFKTEKLIGNLILSPSATMVDLQFAFSHQFPTFPEGGGEGGGNLKSEPDWKAPMILLTVHQI